MSEQESRSRFPMPQSAYEEAVHRAARGYEEVEHMVQRNPASAVFVAFGLGVGLGVLLGNSIAHASYFREPERGMAERVGLRVLDALAGVLPESMSASLRR